MSDYRKIDLYLEQNLEKSLAELSRLVAQPSVGAQNLGLKECAALVHSLRPAPYLSISISTAPGRHNPQFGSPCQ